MSRKRGDALPFAVVLALLLAPGPLVADGPETETVSVSYDALAPAGAAARELEWGATVNLPLVRDKTHFFLSYESLREDRGVRQVPGRLVGELTALDALGQVIASVPLARSLRTGKAGIAAATFPQTLWPAGTSSVEATFDVMLRGRKRIDEWHARAGFVSYEGCTETAQRGCFEDGRFSASVEIEGQPAQIFPPRTTEDSFTFFVGSLDVSVRLRNLCKSEGGFEVDVEASRDAGVQATVRDLAASEVGTGQLREGGDPATSFRLATCGVGF